MTRHGKVSAASSLRQVCALLDLAHEAARTLPVNANPTCAELVSAIAAARLSALRLSLERRPRRRAAVRA